MEDTAETAEETCSVRMASVMSVSPGVDARVRRVDEDFQIVTSEVEDGVGHCLWIAEIDLLIENPPRGGAVHGTRVEVGEIEVVCESARNAGFTDAAGPSMATVITVHLLFERRHSVDDRMRRNQA